MDQALHTRLQPQDLRTASRGYLCTAGRAKAPRERPPCFANFQACQDDSTVCFDFFCELICKRAPRISVLILPENVYAQKFDHEFDYQQFRRRCTLKRQLSRSSKVVCAPGASAAASFALGWTFCRFASTTTGPCGAPCPARAVRRSCARLRSSCGFSGARTTDASATRCHPRISTLWEGAVVTRRFGRLGRLHDPHTPHQFFFSVALYMFSQRLAITY